MKRKSKEEENFEKKPMVDFEENMHISVSKNNGASPRQAKQALRRRKKIIMIIMKNVKNWQRENEKKEGKA